MVMNKRDEKLLPPGIFNLLSNMMSEPDQDSGGLDHVRDVLQKIKVNDQSVRAINHLLSCKYRL